MNVLRMAMLYAALTLGSSFGSTASAQQPRTQKSLYDRLGGPKGITLVVDDFINRLVVNEELNKNPAIDAGRKNSPAPYLKFQVSQLVCGVTGGPCKGEAGPAPCASRPRRRVSVGGLPIFSREMR